MTPTPVESPLLALAGLAFPPSPHGWPGWQKHDDDNFTSARFHASSNCLRIVAGDGAIVGRRV